MDASEFLQTLDRGMAMKPASWLQESLQNPQDLYLVDLRGPELWAQGHIPLSEPLLLAELPTWVATRSKQATIVCICNGSVQSAMAVMFLRMQGFSQSWNLSGGYSSWVRNQLPVELS